MLRQFARAILVFFARVFHFSRRPEPVAQPDPPPLPAARTHRTPIFVQLQAPKRCAITGCRRDPTTWVSLSSRDRLYLCGKHALAVETQRTRWRTSDPTAATHRISRITVAKA